MRPDVTRALARSTGLVAAITLVVVTAAADTILVDPDGTGDHATIQAAIDASSDGDVIELGDGVFSGPGNRDLDPGGRAITIRSRSGDAAACVIRCDGTALEPHRGFHVQNAETGTTRIERLTIRGGHAAGAGPTGSGGAILCQSTSPAIAGCVFDSNHGNVFGGALYLIASRSTIDGCTFRDNQGADMAGAVYCSSGSEASIRDCVFETNTANVYGGAIRCSSESGAVIERCVFIGNTAFTSGGALYCSSSSSVTVRDCVFVNNLSSEGGAIACDASSPAVERSTFHRNRATTGGAIFLRSASSLTLNASIIVSTLYGGAVACDDPGISLPVLTCTDVFDNGGGDWTGCIADQAAIDGNRSEDPQFCSTDPAADGNWTLQDDSPCAAGPCGVIGAGAVACGSTPVRRASWSRVKDIEWR